MALGMALRLSHFVHRRSLWLDEATLALNVLGRSYARLLAPLDNHQGAPIGYLWITKATVTTLGDSEFALRAFAFLAGLAVLPLTYAVARRITSRPTALVVLAIVAFCPALIYYSNEMKQYSSDVLVALGILFTALCVLDTPLHSRHAATLALVGTMAMLLSHPAAFVLAGVGVALLSDRVYRRRWQDAVLVGAVCGVWALVLVVQYVYLLRPLAGDVWLHGYWASGMAPRAGGPLVAARWPYDAFFASFRSPMGFAFPGLAGTLALVGGIGLGQRDWRKLLLLVLPVVCVAGAAAVRAYPFADRLILFVVPLYAILIGEGVRLLAHGARSALFPVVVVLLVVLLGDSVQSELRKGLRPGGREEVREALAYVARNARPGDVLYVYNDSKSAFHHYRSRFPIREQVIVEGASSYSSMSTFTVDLARDIDQLEGHARVWSLFSHFSSAAIRAGVPEDSIQHALEAHGRRLDERHLEGASVYLAALAKRSARTGRRHRAMAAPPSGE